MLCAICKRQSSKGDICYACRERAAKRDTRAMTDYKVDVILSESPANALKRLQELQKRVREGDESCRAELQQAKAILRPRLTVD